MVTILTNDDDLKRLWKEEADQQRRDNQGKPKEFRRREVPIRFGGVKRKNEKNKTKLGALDSENTASDDFYRQQLGV